MTILTQDTARQFLGNSSAADKYKLFMRGVQLSQLDTDYTMVEGQISALQATLDTRQEALADLKQKEVEWRNRVQIFEQSAEIEEEVRTLQNQYAWSQVKEQEKVYFFFGLFIIDRGGSGGGASANSDKSKRSEGTS
jgi:chromosome segregation ATPase